MFLSGRGRLTGELRCADTSRFYFHFGSNKSKEDEENPKAPPNMPGIVTELRFPEVGPHSWAEFVQENRRHGDGFGGEPERRRPRAAIRRV